MNKLPYQKVKSYFQNLESQLGYNLILWGYKHFGYHPSGKKIPEKEALVKTQDLLAQKLNLSQKDFVLDAGCGQGKVACYLAKNYGCHVTGITVIPFEVNKAVEYAKKMEVSGKTDFLEMDFVKTNFKDKSFSAIFCLESFCHTYDMDKTLKEFKRLLRPGGRLAIFDYSIAEDQKIRKFLDKTFPDKRNFYEKFIDWFVKKSGMYNFKKQRHGVIPKKLINLGLKDVQEFAVTKNMLPSAKRLYDIARLPYKFIKLFHLQDFFINTSVAAEVVPLVIAGMNYDFFRYNITTARKAS